MKVIQLFILAQTASAMTHTSQCDATKAYYKDLACCGEGGGSAVCATSPFDNDALIAKIDNIAAHLDALTLATSPSPPYYTGQTLWDVCYPGLDPSEPAIERLGQYPPVEQSDPLYTAWYDNKTHGPSFNWEAGRIDENGRPVGSEHKFSEQLGALFPPFFGMCASAQGYYTGIAPMVCGGSTPDLCERFERAARVFSVVLQLEFFSQRSDVPQGMQFGSQWVGSVFKSSPTNAFGITNWTSGLTDYFSATNDMLRDTISNMTTNQVFTDPIKQYTLSVISTGQNAFNTHFQGMIATTPQTSATDPSINIRMIHDGDFQYPAHFEICGASKDLFDYMLQNPTMRFPDRLSDNFNHMLRCDSIGMRLLKIHSLILGWEKATVDDTQMCPTSDQVSLLLDEHSMTLRRISEVYSGLALTLEPVLYQAPPTQTQSFWVPGLDIEYMREMYFTFVKVHVDALERQCDIEIEFGDLTAKTNLRHTIRSTHMTVDVAKHIQNFPRVSPAMWESPFPDCPSYAYGGISDFNGDTMPMFNLAPKAPRENDCTMENHPAAVRRAEVEAYWPNAPYWPISDEETSSCVYDPVGGFRITSGGPANQFVCTGLYLSIVKSGQPVVEELFRLSDLLHCLEPENQTPETVPPECFAFVCDIPVNLLANPGSISTYQYEAPGQPAFTAADVCRPLCAATGHNISAAVCQSP